MYTLRLDCVLWHTLLLTANVCLEANREREPKSRLRQGLEQSLSLSLHVSVCLCGYAAHVFFFRLDPSSVSSDDGVTHKPFHSEKTSIYLFCFFLKNKERWTEHRANRPWERLASFRNMRPTTTTTTRWIGASIYLGMSRLSTESQTTTPSLLFPSLPEKRVGNNFIFPEKK